MKISYDLQLPDVVAFQKHLLIRSKKHKTLKNITQIIVPLIISAVVIFKIVNEQFLTQTQIFLFGGLAILWLVLHQLFFEKIVFRKVKKTIEAQKNSLGLGKNSVEITNKGIDFWQEKENLLLPFTRFLRLDETPKYLFLVINEFAGICINKETADIKNFQKFVSAFQEKLQ